MKRLKIILLAIFFILLFGLFSESKVSAVIFSVNYNRVSADCVNGNHENGCKVYQFTNIDDGRTYNVHMGPSNNLVDSNKDENIPDIRTWGVFCMQHGEDANIGGEGGDLRYKIDISGTSTYIYNQSSTAAIISSGISYAPELAYAITNYEYDAANVIAQTGITDKFPWARLSCQRIIWDYIGAFSDSAYQASGGAIQVIDDSSKTRDHGSNQYYQELLAEANAYGAYIRGFYTPQVTKREHNVIEEGDYYKIGPININYVQNDTFQTGFTGVNSLSGKNGIINRMVFG